MQSRWAPGLAHPSIEQSIPAEIGDRLLLTVDEYSSNVFQCQYAREHMKYRALRHFPFSQFDNPGLRGKHSL